jgi:hypothetical protein
MPYAIRRGPPAAALTFQLVLQLMTPASAPSLRPGSARRMVQHHSQKRSLPTITPSAHCQRPLPLCLPRTPTRTQWTAHSHAAGLYWRHPQRGQRGCHPRVCGGGGRGAQPARAPRPRAEHQQGVRWLLLRGRGGGAGPRLGLRQGCCGGSLAGSSITPCPQRHTHLLPRIMPPPKQPLSVARPHPAHARAVATLA